MFSHSVFGLRLQGNTAIPGLVALPVASPADVRLWLGLMPPWLDREDEPQPMWYCSPERDDCGEPLLEIWELDGGAYFRLRFAEGTEFLVDRSGEEIWAGWPETVALEETASHLLGRILSFALRLRGVTCLHASAIAVAGRAVAFLGPEGAGKSTTAAAFAGRGYPVLTDDLVALWDQGRTFLVQPGFPWLRLRPPSMDILGGPPGSLPRLTPTPDRCYLDLDLRQNGYPVPQRPFPLAAIYLLGERCSQPEAPWVEAVPAAEGLIALAVNTWVTRVLDRSMRVQELELLSRVRANVPVRRVRPHAGAACLSRLCDMILEDFESAAGLEGEVQHVQCL